MTYREIQERRHAAILLNQQNGKAELYDLAGQSLDNSSLLADWDTGYATGLKLRHSEQFGGDCLFVATEGAVVFSLDSREKLWEAPAYGDNAHSIEWIEPLGILCLACSTGASLLFYHPQTPDRPFAVLPLADAHGVLWDDKRQVLWAAGLDRLVQIRFPDGLPAISREYRTPEGIGGAHDLAAVYGNPDKLWLTCNRGRCVLQFDKETERFLRDYPGSDIITAGVYHKGIGNFIDGGIAWLYPDGVIRDSKYHKNASWLTDRIYYYDGTAVRELISPTGQFYKLRVCNTDYQ